MSITDSSHPHNFQTIEDELKYWKTSYSELYGKYETLNENYKQLLSCPNASPKNPVEKDSSIAVPLLDAQFELLDIMVASTNDHANNEDDSETRFCEESTRSIADESTSANEDASPEYPVEKDSSIAVPLLDAQFELLDIMVASTNDHANIEDDSHDSSEEPSPPTQVMQHDDVDMIDRSESPKEPSNNAPKQPKVFNLRKRSDLTESEKKEYQKSLTFINQMNILNFDKQKFGYHERLDKYFAVNQSEIYDVKNRNVTEKGVKTRRCRLKECTWKINGASATKEEQHFNTYHKNDFVFVGYHETESIVGVVWHDKNIFSETYNVYKILKTDIDFPYLVFEDKKCRLSHLLKEAMFLPEREKIREYVSNASDNDELKKIFISKQDKWKRYSTMTQKEKTAVDKIKADLLARSKISEVLDIDLEMVENSSNKANDARGSTQESGP